MASSTSVDKVADTLAKADLKDKDEDPEEVADNCSEESTDDPKAGAQIWRGHEEAMKKVAELLEHFGLPLGLLPLKDVIELGFVESTGYMWITQKNKVEHTFSLIGKQVRYAEEIKSVVEKEKIKKLNGVKAKELFLWVPLSDITVSGDRVHFKSFAGITKGFSVEAFAAGQ